MATIRCESVNPEEINLKKQCKDENCELIDTDRISLMCRGGVDKKNWTAVFHKPVFLFHNLDNKELIEYHVVRI